MSNLLFIARFLARCAALIGARRCTGSSSKHQARGPFKLADSDPGHLEARASLAGSSSTISCYECYALLMDPDGHGPTNLNKFILTFLT